MNPISISNLKKSYGRLQAVRGVSFDVRPGEIFGLIGPDGAGKTTILRVLVSLLNADDGQVMFYDKEVAANPTYVRARIGYMPQRFSLYQDLTVEENLSFFGDLFKVPRKRQDELKNRLYEFSRLGPFKNRRAANLSGGMKQKLALSCMLMHEPQVVVLDEPTFGVDPVSRSEFWDILKNLAGQGTSLLVTTAYMDEAELCDRVGLIFEGQLLAMDKPAELISHYPYPLYLIETESPHQAYEVLSKTEFADAANLFGNGVHLEDRLNRGPAAMRENMEKMHIGFQDFRVIDPQLEDLFLHLIRQSSSTSKDGDLQ